MFYDGGSAQTSWTYANSNFAVAGGDSSIEIPSASRTNLLTNTHMLYNSVANEK